MVSRYAILGDDIQSIADAVRLRTGHFDRMDIPAMVERLKESFIAPTAVTQYCALDDIPWTRPADWPDLDSLNLQMSGDDFIYMTYDAGKEASAIAWHIETADGNPATLDIGHIENGLYIADETHEILHRQNYVQWTDDLDGFLVLRVTGPVTRCYSISTSRDSCAQSSRQQPILERVAWVPHMTAFSASNVSNVAWATWLLERDVVANEDGEALTDMSYMYQECSRLRSLDISGLHTPNVTSMANLFSGCFMLGTELDLRHLSVGKVRSLANAFANCRMLRRIDLRGWDTQACTTFTGMFADCRRTEEIKGLEDFNTSASTTFSSMFSSCGALYSAHVEHFDTSNATTLASMFYGCTNLRELDLSAWDVGKVTTVTSMFNSCWSLRRLNISGWETGALTTVASAFSACYNLQQVDISGWNVTHACTNINSLFSNCWSIREIHIPETWDVSGLGDANNTGNSVFTSCYSVQRITGIKNWQFYHKNSCANMFQNCYSLVEVDVSGWRVNSATSLAGIFSNCRSLKRVDLSSWQPKNCVSLASMFLSCYSLVEIGDISNWDVSKGTSFASMFSGMGSVKNITLRNWNLASCTTVANMFSYEYSLRKAVLTGWAIPNVTTSPASFLGNCWNLEELEIDLPFTLNHSYTNDRCLSHESVIRILKSLPRVTGSRVLNLTSTNLTRLSPDEKRIATDKGWALAN